MRHLREEGFDPTGWRITFIATPRIFGYQFNPASFYLCRDSEGALRVVIIEVHNTHGERRLYTLRPERHGSGWVDSMDKDFYVSPFIDMDARYRVRVQDDPRILRIAIVGDRARIAPPHRQPGAAAGTADRPDAGAAPAAHPLRHAQDHRRPSTCTPGGCGAGASASTATPR